MLLIKSFPIKEIVTYFMFLILELPEEMIL